MIFKGSNTKLTMWFQLLVTIYGADATIVDIQRSIATIRK